MQCEHDTKTAIPITLYTEINTKIRLPDSGEHGSCHICG